MGRTAGEVAGLLLDSVAAEQAAEGGGAVALQPCPKQLHPFLRETKGAVGRWEERSTPELHVRS
jgi:hypothetical protein